MRKAILFILIFFLGFLFANTKYANATDACNYNTSYSISSIVYCGLPNYCSGCDTVNKVVVCQTDSNGKIIGDINNCQYVQTDIHKANDIPNCAATCATPAPSPVVCQTITCFGNSGAGGSCGYGTAGSPPGGGNNVDIGINNTLGSCTSYKCASTPNGVPGHTVSVCQSNNCYFNSCDCWPDNACPLPATPAPTFAPAAVCPVPPSVNNIRVTCPYCGF